MKLPKPKLGRTAPTSHDPKKRAQIQRRSKKLQLKLELRRIAGNAKWRTWAAEALRYGRFLDKRGGWSISFDVGLSELNTKFYRMDVTDFIRRHKAAVGRRNYRVLDLGCGSGRAASDLAGELSGVARVSATGLRRLPSWKMFPHSMNVDWHVVHVDRLSKVFPHESFDFIHSNMGFCHSQPMQRIKLSFREVFKVLRRQGHFIITSDNGLVEIPDYFRLVAEQSFIIPARNPELSSAVYLYHLQKP